MLRRLISSSQGRLWRAINIDGMVRKRTMASTILPSSTSSPILDFHIEDNVQDAISNGLPVVALESTIVAHGMPYPQNYDLVTEVGDILRGKGVVPATIAIRDGQVKIGLSQVELDDLARSGEEGRATKCSTRDLPFILSQKRIGNTTGNSNDGKTYWGATTVASTMKLASLAGIQTFVTGGIGGVHRDGENTMDISADLTELSQSPIVVVSAGIKSILDIPKTLEVLETNSVPTFGWRCNEFPAFFSSSSSGVKCPARVDNSDEVASVYWTARALQLPQGMLVAVPNNDPAGENVERAIQSSLRDAEEMDIRGPDLTPFILKNVAELTEGDSLLSNMALVRQNASVGADIAIAIAETSPRAVYSTSSTVMQNDNPFLNKEHDNSSAPPLVLSKNVGILKNSCELQMSPLSPDHPARHNILKCADILVLDGGGKGQSNVKAQSRVAKQAVRDGAEVVYIPSGVRSVITAYEEHRLLSCVKYAILDVEELLAISDGWTDSPEDIEFALHEDDFRTLKRAAKRTIDQMQDETGACIMVLMGDKGLLLATKEGKSDVTFQKLQHTDGIEIYKGTAASDCLSGTFVHELLEGRNGVEASVEGYNSVVSLLSEGKLFYPFLSQYSAKGASN